MHSPPTPSREVLPVGMEPLGEWLHGLALDEGAGEARALRYFPRDALPQVRRSCETSES